MAIADTITSMQNHTSNAYTMIGYGTDLTGINKNLENLSSTIFEAFLEALRTPDTLFTNLPKKSGTGAIISLNDTANAPMRIELGASELTQDGTPTPSSPQAVHTISGSNKVVVCGKNIFDYSSASNINNTVQGTYRTYKISGLKTNTNYNINGLTFTSTLSNQHVYLWTTDTYPGGMPMILANPREYSTSKVFTSNAEGSIYLAIYPNTEATWNTLITYFKNAQIELGSTATTYTPYISQEAEVDLSSKNLFDISKVSKFVRNDYTTEYSTSYISINNGIITDQRGTYDIWPIMYDTRMTLPAGTYTISAYAYSDRDSGNKGADIGFWNFTTSARQRFSTTLLEYKKWQRISGTFTLTQDTDLAFVVVGVGQSGDYTALNMKFKDIQLEVGTAPTEYTSYFGEYCKIGNYEDKFIRTSGKNLLQPQTYGFGITVGDGSLQANSSRYCQICEAEEGKKYTISRKSVGSSSYWYYGFYGSELVAGLLPVNGVFGNMGASALSYTTQQAPAGTKYLAVFYGSALSDEGMVNEGTTALPYEPYGSNEWYIKKNIGKVVLNGSESWTKQVPASASSWYYETQLSNLNIIANSTTSNTMCSHYSIVEISNTNTLKGMFIISNGKIRIREENEDTASNFTNWLTTHNVSIYYILSTPTYTQITGTLANQLENVYKNMLSQAGQTSISQINADLPFNMSIQAIEDME